MTPFGESDASLSDLLVNAILGAWGNLDLGGRGSLYLASIAPAELAGEPDLERVVGLRLRSALGQEAEVLGRFETGAAALFEATTSLKRGACDWAVIAGGEKMTHLGPAQVSSVLAHTVTPFAARTGATLPALGGLIASHYLWTTGAPRNAFREIALKNHENATRNPLAHLQSGLTREEYEASPLVAAPLRLFDCSPRSDGAAAVILAKHDGAGPGDGPFLIGAGLGRDHPLLHHRQGISQFRHTARAARAAMTEAGLSPDEIDLVEVHDAFTPFELINLEAMGFFETGKGWRSVLEGTTRIDGGLPVNPSGGLKARGHPIGASGLASTVEVALQLRGRAGERQIRNAGTALVQSIGGMASESFVFVWRKDPVGGV